MKITINDIAKMANVSKSTVSKVMSDDSSISDATKQKVKSIMKEMNYIPNSMARHLATQKSTTIGLMINLNQKEYYLNPYFNNLLGGVEQVICSNDYELNIRNIQAFRNKKDFMSKYVYNKQLAGMILPASVLTKEILNELNEVKFPYVVIGQTHEFYDASWIDINNVLGSEIATIHLLEQGYKKIAFIGGSNDEPISYSRQMGYQNVLNKNNKSKLKSYILTGGCTEDAGYELTIGLLEKDKDVDAILCINNYVAYGALRAIKELNIVIPNEIGIVTFDNIPLAPYTTPKLTALDIDTFELGQLAASSLLKKIDNKNAPHQTSLISPRLIIRESSVRTKNI